MSLLYIYHIYIFSVILSIIQCKTLLLRPMASQLSTAQLDFQRTKPQKNKHFKILQSYLFLNSITEYARVELFARIIQYSE